MVSLIRKFFRPDLADELKTNDVRKAASRELDLHQVEINPNGRYGPGPRHLYLTTEGRQMPPEHEVHHKPPSGNSRKTSHMYIVTLNAKIEPIREKPYLLRLGLVERLGYLTRGLPKFGVLVKMPSGRYAQLTGANVYKLDQRVIKPLLGIKNGGGRPPILVAAGSRTMYIRSADHIKLKEISGTGSVSAGLRRLLSEYEHGPIENKRVIEA